MSKQEEIFYEKIKIDGVYHEYLMIRSIDVLKVELEKLGCRLPFYNEYKCNLALSPLIRKKMVQHNTKWAICTNYGNGKIYYYKENSRGKGLPYIVFLSELIDYSKLTINYLPKIQSTLRIIGQIELPEVSSDWSPLMIAVLNKKTEIVKLLLKNGADANYSDSRGLTPLMIASVFNEIEIIEALILHGADVNARSKNSFSAVIYAIYANAKEAVSLLTKNGADIKISINPKVIEEKHTFLETLEFYISKFSLNGLSDLSLIYKKCGISKQLFSKIRSNKKSTYHPRKETVLQLAIGLRLTLAQAESLLESAGYIFEENNPVDKIFKEHITRLDFDIMVINEEIWKKTGKSFLKDE